MARRTPALALAMISLLLAFALALAPGPVAPNAPLPPGHPSVGPALPPGHPPVRGGAPKTADELVRDFDAQKDLKDREKSFEVAGSIGKLYYGRGRFADAAVYLGQAWDKSKELRAAAGRLPAKAGECAERNLSLDGVVAKLKAQPEAVAACGRRFLQEVVDLGEMRAVALFLSGDGEGALTLLDELLQLAPDRATSVFLRGAIRFERGAEDPAALREAKADLERAEKLEPGTGQAGRAHELAARAEQLIAAGGAAKLAAKNEVERRPTRPDGG
jgi:tetratricopeptide (TPR) repeat protein